MPENGLTPFGQRPHLHPAHWLEQQPRVRGWFLEENADPYSEPDVQSQASALTTAWVLTGDYADERAYRAALEHEIRSAHTRAQTPGWDGYGAAQVSEQAVANAIQFARIIPTGSMPDIMPHPDGDLAFEWWFGPDCVLTVSVNESDIVHHASIVGRVSNHGKEELHDRFPPTIALQLNRVLNYRRANEGAHGN